VTGFRRLITRRGWVHSVLGVWVLAWALVFLEPCCEAIAASVPHSHAPAASAAHHHREAAVDPGARLALHHDHCEHVDARDLNQPVDVTVSGLKVPQHAVIVAHAIAPTFPPLATQAPAAPLLAAARASPVPLYLRTLRLRD